MHCIINAFMFEFPYTNQAQGVDHSILMHHCFTCFRCSCVNQKNGCWLEIYLLLSCVTIHCPTVKTIKYDSSISFMKFETALYICDIMKHFLEQVHLFSRILIYYFSDMFQKIKFDEENTIYVTKQHILHTLLSIFLYNESF